ncbi:MAG: glutathione S-transferase family protein [Panacagrimonas sp.]
MLELFTFRMSHFSEKVRWMLDAARIEYRETGWTPFFHMVPALRHGRVGTTVPILKHGGGYVQDSTRIMLWLDTNMPGFHLLPRDTASRQAALEIEERFDRMGSHVIRYAYSRALENPQAIVDLWTLDSGPLQRRFIATTFPVLRKVFKLRFGLDAGRVAHSRKVIAESLDFLDAQLADGREYLVGDEFSVADITACALLAPLIGPDEHPVYSRDDFRATMAPLVTDWIERPAAQWVRKRYRARR